MAAAGRVNLDFANFFEQLEHLDHGLGGFDSLVANTSAGPLQCLLECVAVKADLSDAAADDAIDVVVVGRFALDHAAQADDRIKLFSFYQPQRRVRQLPRTGNPENRNIVFGDAIAQQGLNGTIRNFSYLGIPAI